MKIVGVSFDTPTENQDWAIDESFEFDLWSDTYRDLALHYGAASTPTQGSASRITKILDADGDLVLEYPFVSVGTHPGQVLQDCQILFGP